MTTDANLGSMDERHAQGVIELIVPDPDETLLFYVTLGFEVERRTAEFVALRGHGCRLFLAHDPVAGRPAVQGCNLRIIVDDVDALYQRLLRAGVSITRRPDNRSYGLRDFSVRDPNGFVVRFAQVIDA